MPELIEEPEKPLPSDCCGGGACCPCVWDAYYAQREKWLLQQKLTEGKSDNQPGIKKPAI